MIAGIICGILAGFIACKLTNKEGKGCIVDLFLGIIGGAVGGFGNTPKILPRLQLVNAKQDKGNEVDGEEVI